MDDLIEALGILKKYMNTEERCPTICEHDVLIVLCDNKKLPEADTLRLNELGFFFSKEFSYWASFRFGSA